MFACIYIPNASSDAQSALLDCATAFSPRVETGNVFIQQLYRDWYNVDANLLYQSLVTYQRISMFNPRRIAVILRKFLYHLGS